MIDTTTNVQPTPDEITINSENNDADSSSTSATSDFETILAILKGNIGPGCLALPWAFTILGIPLGCIVTSLITLLVGFNAWTLVDLKRRIWGSQRGFTYSVSGAIYH